ncbi:MAG TPA: GNAT family N-acetyltransferase [Tepidisphaeraceae bacterium]|nr:GNAT family N-acetyltransferase [Tepidisphaeraceae bacterium]
MSITLRPHAPADAPAVGKLAFDAFGDIARQHNFPYDFPAQEMAHGFAEMICNHPNLVGRVAVDGQRVVGCNFLWRRNRIGGVGPICVEPSLQARGTGRRLMQAIIDAGRDMPGIRLVQDSFNRASLSLYASLGFDVREPLAVMTGKLAAPAPAGATARPMTADDLPRCAEICTRVHGFDRTGELRDAIGMFRAHVLERGGRVVAYASSPWIWHMNHGVAETEADLHDLLAGISATVPDPIALLVPLRQTDLFRWLMSQGARVMKPMNLMSMGWYQEPVGNWFPSVEY